MSPRSDELIQAARRRLAAASVVVDQDPSAALSAAYYAMLYAARAEEVSHGDRGAGGSWVGRGRIGAAETQAQLQSGGLRKCARRESNPRPAV